MAVHDLAKIPAMAKEYRRFIDQYNDMFVGRERQLKLICYALLLRQHVLLFGPPGTSKTALCDAIFAGITGAQTFATELTKFMGEEAIFGPYNVRRLREEGVLEHNVAGMAPEAHFMRVGEMLDGSEPLLRSLLSLFHERRMIRGTQRIQTPLMTAYADTNIDPAEFLRRNPNAWAVLDRLMFIDRLDYLDDPALVAEMVSRFQRGATKRPGVTISVEIIEHLSSFIVTPPGLISDRSVGDAYATAASEYRVRRRNLPKEVKGKFILPEISDRRIAIASQMLEAEAILNGRVEARAEDIMAAGIVLAMTEPEDALWQEIAGKHITEHKRTSAAQIKNSQGLALKGIAEQLEREVINAPSSSTNSDVGQTFQVLWKQFQSITPTDEEIAKVHDQLRGRFAEALKKVQAKKLHDSGLDIEV